MEGIQMDQDRIQTIRQYTRPQNLKTLRGFLGMETDNQALISILNNKFENNRIHRWALLLSEYDCDIQYIQGKRNIIADALTRMDTRQNDNQRQDEDGLFSLNTIINDQQELTEMEKDKLTYTDKIYIKKLKEQKNYTTAKKQYEHTDQDRQSLLTSLIFFQKVRLFVHFRLLYHETIHIELASDLSSEAFIACFRRFISRRGRCDHLYSDCDYLNTLQQRAKWTSIPDNIKLNTLVLIKNELKPSLEWDVGRIVELHPGKDGHAIRVVSVKTSKGQFLRPS
ncbi:hypothetical protein NQ317_019472 [Molorchus minor]|uniref:DUF5641 domain-containing protein n=1 Tax=Molorchus minor TaxID=1323400 RepID=A0ABQ9JSA1_9CUCU|nr:hypothetical protein NQ317_019472 [Molorchus minor]